MEWIRNISGYILRKVMIEGANIIMFKKVELIFWVVEAILFLFLAAIFGNLALVNIMVRVQEIVAIAIGLTIAYVIVFSIRKKANPVKYFKTAMFSLLLAVLLALAAIVAIDAFGKPLIAYVILWVSVIVPMCMNMFLDKKDEKKY